MVNQGLVLEVTRDVVIGILAFSLIRWFGAAIADPFGFFGTFLFFPFYVAALVVGVYFVVRGLGNLIEDIVRQEITHRS